MDIQPTSRELATPLSYKIYKAEDSGYHTSFATPSLESSSLSNDSLDPSHIVPNINCKIKVDCYITPATEARLSKSRYYNCYNLTNTDSSSESTPIARRGTKRSYDDGANEVNSTTVATPTSIIAKEVQKLKVNDNKLIKATSADSGFIDDVYGKDYYGSSVSNPSTPIKKICRSSCNLSPFNRRRSARKVDFAIHSLSCEKQVLKSQPKIQSKESISNKFGYKPNQKIDIIKMLYSHENYCSTSIKKIFHYLSQEDLYNFTLVSPIWCNIFKAVNTKQKYTEFFCTIKSNLENWGDTPKVSGGNQIRTLKEIQNINIIQSTPHSPTRSPRSTRFHKFTKAASLDARSQMVCTNCGYPAKVTIESSGEQWGECTSTSCAHQFCRLCKYERHKGRNCFQYDLVDGPSPSKRKKNTCPVSSNKSKKKLKRLLF
ncbi:uncharacterized protein LOC114349781 [Ostrinia furnacalis]|uniref:uncharacterized protein LOC114349781 n=1 Tax=Ostrinia furnacalis TaxID=93504 RepID=UPI00103B4B0B|nr:uncharacterized protein LOC114349781 [Ostrinia furnacalis]XP_028156093.1 uncharacterized protein LOC114349781 [Ostrinia furnacalis]